MNNDALTTTPRPPSCGTCAECSEGLRCRELGPELTRDVLVDQLDDTFGDLHSFSTETFNKYADEGEEQDGDAYWSLFSSVEELIEDLTLGDALST